MSAERRTPSSTGVGPQSAAPSSVCKLRLSDSGSPTARACSIASARRPPSPLPRRAATDPGAKGPGEGEALLVAETLEGCDRGVGLGLQLAGRSPAPCAARARPAPRARQTTCSSLAASAWSRRLGRDQTRRARERCRRGPAGARAVSRRPDRSRAAARPAKRPGRGCLATWRRAAGGDRRSAARAARGVRRAELLAVAERALEVEPGGSSVAGGVERRGQAVVQLAAGAPSGSKRRRRRGSGRGGSGTGVSRTRAEEALVSERVERRPGIPSASAATAGAQLPAHDSRPLQRGALAGGQAVETRGEQRLIGAAAGPPPGSSPACATSCSEEERVSLRCGAMRASPGGPELAAELRPEAPATRSLVSGSRRVEGECGRPPPQPGSQVEKLRPGEREQQKRYVADGPTKCSRRSRRVAPPSAGRLETRTSGRGAPAPRRAGARPRTRPARPPFPRAPPRAAPPRAPASSRPPRERVGERPRLRDHLGERPERDVLAVGRGQGPRGRSRAGAVPRQARPPAATCRCRRRPRT